MKYIKTVLPSALLLLGANFANSLALAYSGITLCYVVKSTIPLCTVIICVIQGQRFPMAVYLCLFVTVCGVSLASLSDGDFTKEGLFSAMASTWLQTCMNVFTKDRMKQSDLSGQESQFLMVTICSIILIPYQFLYSGKSVDLSGDLGQKEIVAMVLCGVAYHIEYVSNFVIIPKVEPVIFSLMDIIRRLSIILFGAFIFNKQLDASNWLGVILAFGGIFAFNQVNTVQLGAKKDD